MRPGSAGIFFALIFPLQQPLTFAFSFEPDLGIHNKLYYINISIYKHILDLSVIGTVHKKLFLLITFYGLCDKTDFKLRP